MPGPGVPTIRRTGRPGRSVDPDDLEPWNAEHPVLRVLRARRADGSKPGGRQPGDTAKVGLAVEGGGIRGVVSAAMLSAIEEGGFGTAFDAVYGVSSGAINCAYFLAGETWYPVSIYYDDLTTRRFVDFRRAFTGGDILNLGYAFDEVLAVRKPLDYERALAAPVPLKVAVTDVDELRTVLAGGFADRSALRSALLASCWLPIGVHGTATYGGHRAMDGGVLTPLPFRLALRDGCTHVLSLSTRPMDRCGRGPSPFSRYTRRYLERVRPGLGDGYLQGVRDKRRDELLLRACRAGTEPYRGAHLLDLAPLPGNPEVRRHEPRRGPIIEAARSSYEVMYCALAGEPVARLLSGDIQAVPRLTIVARPAER
jgi:predicted patatin/cPLA2 family phospholipase